MNIPRLRSHWRIPRATKPATEHDGSNGIQNLWHPTSEESPSAASSNPRRRGYSLLIIGIPATVSFRVHKTSTGCPRPGCTAFRLPSSFQSTTELPLTAQKEKLSSTHSKYPHASKNPSVNDGPTWLPPHLPCWASSPGPTWPPFVAKTSSHHSAYCRLVRQAVARLCGCHRLGAAPHAADIGRLFDASRLHWDAGTPYHSEPPTCRFPSLCRLKCGNSS